MREEADFQSFRAESNSRNFNFAVQDMEETGNVVGLLGVLDPAFPLPARRRAAKALFRLANKEQTEALVTALQIENDRAVRITLIQTLGKLGDDKALPGLLHSLKDREAQVRLEAAEALARYNSEAAFQALLAALKQKGEDDDRFVRQYAAEALGKLADRRAFDPLVAALKDPSELVRPAAATALGRLGDRRAAPHLKRVRHTSPHSRGSDCAECRAVDAALVALTPPRD